MLYEKRGAVALVTFNRPDMLNAFRTTMFERLRAILDDVGADAAVRVLVLTGSGRAFSAGIDLAEQASLMRDPPDVPLAQAALAGMQNLTRQMVDLPKPIIAAINGAAVGVGAELAIASDVRIASENAYFMFAEVRRALFETNGVMYFLPRLVGLGRAVEMMLTGDKIPAEAALQAGLVTRLHAPADLLPAALNLAERIAANAPISLRLVKQVAARSYDLDLDAVMALETEGMIECLRAADYREGVLSFLEKRAPVYRGR